MQNKTTFVGGGENRNKSSGNEEVAPPQTEFNSSERTALLHALSAAATENTGHEGDVFDWVCARPKTITKTSWKRPSQRRAEPREKQCRTDWTELHETLRSRMTKVARERCKPRFFRRTNSVERSAQRTRETLTTSLGYPEDGPNEIRDFGFKQKFEAER